MNFRKLDRASAGVGGGGRWAAAQALRFLSLSPLRISPPRRAGQPPQSSSRTPSFAPGLTTPCSSTGGGSNSSAAPAPTPCSVSSTARPRGWSSSATRRAPTTLPPPRPSARPPRADLGGWAALHWRALLVATWGFASASSWSPGCHRLHLSRPYCLACSCV